MLRRLRELTGQRRDFAFETTLSSRSYARWIQDDLFPDHEFRLVFLYLDSADLAIRRVAERVQVGGHAVPGDVVRRRYERGLRNFFGIYRPLAHTWKFYDNSTAAGPQLVAAGGIGSPSQVMRPDIWAPLQQRYETES